MGWNCDRGAEKGSKTKLNEDGNDGWLEEDESNSWIITAIFE